MKPRPKNPKKAHQLKVFAQGSGQPVVMLHGLLSTHRYWDDVAAKMPPNSYRLIRPDLLGFGASPRPRNQTYSVPNHIEWLESSLDILGPKHPAILIGHSVGAVFALYWAARRPKLFPRVVLTSLPLLRRDMMAHQVVGLAENDKLLGRPKLERLYFKSMGYMTFVPKRVARRIVSNQPKHVAEDTTKHSLHAHKMIIKNAKFEPEIMDQLHRLEVQTTLIMSRRDTLVADMHSLQKAAKANPNLTLIVTNTSHQVPLEDPRLVADAITGIISSNE